MTDMHAAKEEMEYTVMDARNMSLIPDQCFDLAIDKALFDSLLCSMQNLADIQSLLQEACRVLKFGGSYVMISHGEPESRVPYIKQHMTLSAGAVHVDIKVIPLPKPDLKEAMAFTDVKLLGSAEESKTHFMYICTKTMPSS